MDGQERRVQIFSRDWNKTLWSNMIEPLYKVNFPYTETRAPPRRKTSIISSLKVE